MREIGTLKIGLHIMNLHIKRPRITINKIGSTKKPIFQSHYTKSQIKRPHITRAACICIRMILPERWPRRI